VDHLGEPRHRSVDAFDAEWGQPMKVRLFFNTGDFIFRAAHGNVHGQNAGALEAARHSVRGGESRGRLRTDFRNSI
jgi:hypothetical protein